MSSLKAAFGAVSSPDSSDFKSVNNFDKMMGMMMMFPREQNPAMKDVVTAINNPDVSQNFQSVRSAMQEINMPLDYPMDLLKGMMNDKTRTLGVEDDGKYTFTGMSGSNVFSNKYEARNATLMAGYADAYRASEGIPAEHRDAYVAFARAYYLADMVPNGGNVDQETLQKLAGPIEEHVSKHPAMTSQVASLEDNAYLWKSISERNNYTSMIQTAMHEGHSENKAAIANSEFGLSLHVDKLAHEQGWEPMNIADSGLNANQFADVMKTVSETPNLFSMGKYADALTEALGAAGANQEFIDDYSSRVNQTLESLNPMLPRPPYNEYESPDIRLYCAEVLKDYVTPDGMHMDTPMSFGRPDDNSISFHEDFVKSLEDNIQARNEQYKKTYGISPEQPIADAVRNFQFDASLDAPDATADYDNSYSV